MINVFNINKIYGIEFIVNGSVYEYESLDSLKIGDIVLADTYKGESYGKVVLIKNRKEKLYDGDLKYCKKFKEGD